MKQLGFHAIARKIVQNHMKKIFKILFYYTGKLLDSIVSIQSGGRGRMLVILPDKLQCDSDAFRKRTSAPLKIRALSIFDRSSIKLHRADEPGRKSNV